MITSQFKILYKEKIRNNLLKEHQYKNIMAVPKLIKITLNIGVSISSTDSNALDLATRNISFISGQKAKITSARKSIAGFKIRAGMPIGCKVTLRKERMYDFFEKLIHIVIPRIKDFRGFNMKSFDGRGNYNFGINDQTVFPEIQFDWINDSVRGLDVCITTSANNDKDAYFLLKEFKFPLVKN